MPGVQTTSLPLSVNTAFRFLSLNLPFLRYVSVSAGVVIVSFDLLSRTLNSGTGVSRLTNVSVARSSNCPSALHSIRINCGVSTVNRAFPEVTTALASAFGLSAIAGDSVQASAVKRTRNRFIFI